MMISWTLSTSPMNNIRPTNVVFFPVHLIIAVCMETSANITHLKNNEQPPLILCEFPNTAPPSQQTFSK